MPHELRTLTQQPQETLTGVLIGGGLSAVALVLFVALLSRKTRRRGDRPKAPPTAGSGHRRGKRRRR